MKIGSLNTFNLKIHSPTRGRTKTRPQPPCFLPPFDPCNLPVRRCPVAREEASHRIMILRLGAFGDILMGTPLLAALRHAYPNAHLTWIVGSLEREAIDANPYIDELLVWEGGYWKRMVRKLHYSRWISRMLAFRRELQNRRYDVFISFQPEEWPLLTLGVGAPVSIGIFDTFKRFYGKPRNPHFRRFYTHPYPAPELATHRTDQYLLALGALGLPPVPDEPLAIGYTAADRACADEFLEWHGLAQGKKFVVISPLTTWPTRCWPADRYVALADALARRHGCRIVVTGSAKEQATLEEIAAHMETAPVVMAGELSFRQTTALLNRAALLVSGDTGPMHAASALGIPQIALFGPTSPQWYGPRSPQAISLLHPVPCGPCDQKICTQTGENYLRCQRLITVAEVLEVAAGFLRQPDTIPVSPR